MLLPLARQVPAIDGDRVGSGESGASGWEKTNRIAAAPSTWRACAAGVTDIKVTGLPLPAGCCAAGYAAASLPGRPSADPLGRPNHGPPTKTAAVPPANPTAPPPPATP